MSTEERRNWAITTYLGIGEGRPVTTMLFNRTDTEAETMFNRSPLSGKSERREAVITIEVHGGVVQDVHGLPDGWSYRVCDWDICSDCGNLDSECECQGVPDE